MSYFNKKMELVYYGKYDSFHSTFYPVYFLYRYINYYYDKIK